MFSYSEPWLEEDCVCVEVKAPERTFIVKVSPQLLEQLCGAQAGKACVPTDYLVAFKECFRSLDAVVRNRMPSLREDGVMHLGSAGHLAYSGQ